MANMDRGTAKAASSAARGKNRVKAGRVRGLLMGQPETPWKAECWRSPSQGNSSFAPGAGAPTTRGGGRFICRSTAPGANRSGTHSHPGRVLLRYEVEAGVFVGAPPRTGPGKHAFAPGAGATTIRGGGRLVVGAPPPVRTGQAHIRTRGGCSYDTRWRQVC